MKMNRGYKIIPLILACLFFIPTGCVEHRDINQMYFVIGAVFDYNPQNSQYEVHVQVAKAGAFSKAAGGQEEENFLLYDGRGPTVFQAIRDMAKNGRRIFWGHCEIYIIGQELAQRGTFELVDFLMRDNEIREDAFLVVADGHESLSDMLTLKDGAEKVPMRSILLIIREGVKVHGKTLSVRIREVFNELLQEKSSYLIPLIKVREPDFQAKEANKKFHGSGAAVFKGDRMTAAINPTETRVYNIIINDIVDILEDIKYQGENLVLEEIKSKVKLQPMIKNDEIIMLVKTDVWGNFGAIGQPMDLENPKIVEETQRAFAKKIQKQLQDGIERAKKLRTDYLGFGRAVEVAEPQLWANIKDTWEDEIFPEMPVEVEVKVTILRTGLVVTTKPNVTYEKRK